MNAQEKRNKLIRWCALTVIWISLFFIFISRTLYADVTQYTALSQISNPSSIAQYVAQHYEECARYFQKHNNVYVFANKERDAADLLSVVETAYARISQDIGVPAARRDSVGITVYVLSDSLWYSLKMAPHAAAVYIKGYNEIYVRIYGGQDHVYESVIHELTHLAIDNTASHVPLWFEEGMSQFEPLVYFGRERSVKTRFYSQAALKHELKKDIDLEKLFSVSDYSYPDNKLFYELSFQIIRFINEKGDLAKFSHYYLQLHYDILNAMKYSVDYSLGDYDTLDRELKAFLNRI